MKICYISTGFPLSFQGGITNYVRNLAEDQFERGNEVFVISGPDETEFEYNIYQYKSKIIPRRIQALKDKKALAILEEFFKEHSFDIIHIHMALDIDWDLYSILKPYKYVVSLHDYFFLCPRIKMVKYDDTLCERYDEHYCAQCISWWNTHRITNGIEYRLGKVFHNTKFRLPYIRQGMTTTRYKKLKMLLEGADLLLPVSKRVQEIYEDSGIKGKYQISYIGNLSADNYKEEFDFDINKEYIDIAMIGAVSYLKGADEFIKLAKLLAEQKFRFHFFGRSNEYSDRFVNAGIIDHGPYKQADLPSILNQIDLGCVLSVWEDNGPQVVMEFLNNHIPVIGTRMGGIPDFVNETNGFLYDPYDENGLSTTAEKIRKLDRTQLLQLKKNIRRTTTSYEHGEEINALYKKIINAQ